MFDPSHRETQKLFNALLCALQDFDAKDAAAAPLMQGKELAGLPLSKGIEVCKAIAVKPEQPEPVQPQFVEKPHFEGIGGTTDVYVDHSAGPCGTVLEGKADSAGPVCPVDESNVYCAGLGTIKYEGSAVAQHDAVGATVVPDLKKGMSVITCSADVVAGGADALQQCVSKDGMGDVDKGRMPAPGLCSLQDRASGVQSECHFDGGAVGQRSTQYYSSGTP